MYNRFRYLRRLDKAKNPKIPTLQSPPVDEQTEYTLDDLLYLKSTVVSETNIAEIHKRLQRTRQQRDELVRNEATDLLEHFPFFFAHPQLVSYKIKPDTRFYFLFLPHTFI